MSDVGQTRAQRIDGKATALAVRADVAAGAARLAGRGEIGRASCRERVLLGV